MKSAGFYVDPQAWDSVAQERKGFYEDNPPEDWEECGCCDGYHPAEYTGDCRSDINRWPSEACVAALEGKQSLNHY